LFVFLAMVVAIAPAHAQRRVALVIGNSAYQHTPPLTNPRHDASDVVAALRKHGFEVIEGFDLDKAAFDKKLREFADALRGATAALFYYAGHGLQVEGQNYLMPVDAKLSTPAALDFEMVRLDLVHRSMEREAATSILFVDACRNNPLVRNLTRAMGTRSVGIGRGLAPVEGGVGSLVSFSTQPGNVALDGQGRNSPFAGALVRHVTSASDDLSAILIAVRNDVMQETGGKQVPWEHSALTGRFFFGKPPVQRTESGSNAEEIAWGLVKDAGDARLLRRFLDQNPKTSRRAAVETQIAALEQQARSKAEEALEKAEAAAWARARGLNRLLVYNEFLKDWPKGPHAAEARQNIDRLVATEKRWHQLKETKSPQKLRELAEAARGTEFADMIDARLADIERADKADWDKAEKSRRKAAYDAYLADWLEGGYRSEANARLIEIAKSALEWERIKGSNDEPALEAFLKRPYMADFHGAALGELIALRKMRSEPLPPAVSELSAEAMAKLINGKTIRFIDNGTWVSFNRGTRPPGKAKFSGNWLRTATGQKFALEGPFAAELELERNRFTIGGIGGVQEQPAGKTGFLLLMQTLPSDEKGPAGMARLHMTFKIIKVGEEYVCVGTQWGYMNKNEDPPKFNERCRIE
jgi:uncharacterized caspase-like protein